MILEKLLESLNQFEEDSTNYQLSKYVVKNLDKIPSQSIDELAQNCFVSKSRISKYVKKLGFSSFGQFKEECRVQLQAYHVGRCDIDYQTQDYFQEFNCRLKDNIDYFTLHFHHYDDFIETIKQHDLIYIYSQGDSRYLCYYLQYQLGFKGKSVIICDFDEFVDMSLPEESIALVISSLGNSLTMSSRLLRQLEGHDLSWVISSKEIDNTSIYQLHIPVEDKQYSDIILKLALDYIVSRL